jgi:hypothetical protein
MATIEANLHGAKGRDRGFDFHVVVVVWGGAAISSLGTSTSTSTSTSTNGSPAKRQTPNAKR